MNPQPTIYPPSLTDSNLSAIRKSYQKDGFVIIDDFLSNYQDGQVQELRQASERVIRATRDGIWKDRRIVGDPFPPFTQENPDSWGVQNLLHPLIPHGQDPPRARDAVAEDHNQGSRSSTNPFASFYSSEPLLKVCSTLLSVNSSDSLQMELFNLLIEPSQHAFALPWHRDDVKAAVSPEEESTRLKAPDNGIQWNIALQDDSCLYVIPGTHKRLRNEQERNANAMQAPKPVILANQQGQHGFDGAWQIDPQTTLRVDLKAGQAVFYSQRILHRASYLPNRKRVTLHGCYGAINPMDGIESENLSQNQREELELAARERARNILQHNVSWMRESSFKSTLPENLRPMYDNLMRMEGKWRGREGELGYSL